MTSFKQRSYQKELLDGNDIPFDDIKKNMQELDAINRWLGGHKITMAGFKALLKHAHKNETIHIVEIGCGGGDNLRVIKSWAEKNNLSVKTTGIDINKECIEFAKQQAANRGINFIFSDYKNAKFHEPPHIIFSSLFCHHFTNEELQEMLQWLYKNCRTGFFINDLHRHVLAYHSIQLLTQLFSKSYLVKNDAPLSVQRGFVKDDWKSLLQKSAIKKYSINWKWAFRWLIIAAK